MSETRAKTMNIELDGGHRLMTTLASNPAAGAAILVHKRHVPRVSRSAAVGDRIIFVDVTVGGRKLRIIAVYLPHSGYERSLLDETYDQLGLVISEAQAAGRAIVLGGDFNSQSGHSARGDLLDNFLQEHKLSLTTDAATQPWEEIWTFKTSLGVTRAIDYIAASTFLPVNKAQATDDLDLGSDHRAVTATLSVGRPNCRRRCKPRSNKRWKPDVMRYGLACEYQRHLSERIADEFDGSIQSLEAIVEEAAATLGKPADVHDDNGNDDASTKPWNSAAIQTLRQQRRGCRDRRQRQELSKTISKLTRKALRSWQTRRAEQVLESKRGVSSLDGIWRQPVKREVVCEISADEFATSLEDVFHSASTPPAPDRQKIAEVPAFTAKEVEVALKRMATGKTQDDKGLVTEMFKHGGVALYQSLADAFNGMLRNGMTDSSWKKVLFAMLPKSGDPKITKNWRPIAILRITYKIFARTLYQRLQPILDAEQPPDQVGFRPNASTADALLVWELMCGKALEWNTGLWAASVDLTKAFDKIEYDALFAALREQGLDECYVALLMDLYQGQTGTVGRSKPFPILRGVRQGDILSPLLFNAGSEFALRKWKQRLESHGWRLSFEGPERLTNIRFADDIMLYAKSPTELREMLDLLQVEFGRAGLQLNPSKTKVFTTSPPPVQRQLVTAAGPVQVLTDGETHKYLGKALAGNARERSDADLRHRVCCAWAKWGQHRQALVNKKISLKLRLQLFSSVVTPSALYALQCSTLSRAQLQHLDAIQRRMLRNIVGWRRKVDEPWADTMRLMKRRLELALTMHPVERWSDSVLRLKHRLAVRVASGPANAWARQVAQWEPQQVVNETTVPVRFPGRPKARWNDCFSTTVGSNEHWLSAISGISEDTFLSVSGI
jgi:endonuclease/exonuclease/phosphatase family metal-dependent hydrolase